MIEMNDSDLGDTEITGEVLEIVAGISATEIEGVAAMSSGFTGGIAKMLGRSDLSRGVSIEEQEEGVIVNLKVIMEFEVNIPEVSYQVQKRVKNALEKMTGVTVKAVNVNVLGINITEEEEEPEPQISSAEESESDEEDNQ